jgi:hypothetical protein
MEFNRIVYYGWDETGVDTVWVDTDKTQVVAALEAYAERLNRSHEET